MSLVVICSASWVILHRSRAEVVYIPDTSPCFEIEFTFGDGKVEPTLNEKGKSVYGTDFDYSIEWIGGKYAYDKTKDIPNPFSMRSAVQLPAGLHYYRIVDNITGQVVCEQHEVVVKQATLTVFQENNSHPTPLFPGQSFQYNAMWESPETGTTITSPKVNYTVKAEDFNKFDSQICENTIEISAKDVVFSDTVEKELFYNNYNMEEAEIAEIKYGIFSTCYSRTGTTNKFYVNIDQALDETAKENASGTSLIAMQSFSYGSKTYSAKVDGEGDYEHVISSGKTVGANVTLKIPYLTSGNAFDASEGQPDVTDATKRGATLSPRKVNKIILNGDLTNNGIIEVAGTLGNEGQGFAGGTSGDFAEFRMVDDADGATLTSTGTLNVFGYIVGGDSSMVDAKGTINMPFVAYDFHGGNHTVGAYNRGKIAPFSTFDMPNIQVLLKVYGGKNGSADNTAMWGHADLHTGSFLWIEAQHNLTQMKILGASDALFCIENGYAIFDYKCANKDTYYTVETLKASEVEINLNGKTQSGTLSMDINNPLSGEKVHVSMTDVICGVSHKITLTLKGAYEYTFTSLYKFMPGSVLNVEKDATLIVENGAGLLFYGSFTGADASPERIAAYNAHPQFYTYGAYDPVNPSVCNIAGTLTVKSGGSIGGKLTPISADAVLNLSDATNLSMTEIEGIGSATGFDETYKETQLANGLALHTVYADGSHSLTGMVQNLSKQKYTVYSLGENSFAWYPEKATVSFNVNGGVNIAPITVPIDEGGADQTAFAGIPTTPTYAGATFEGWFIDEALTIKLEDRSQIYEDITLYAKWHIEKQYDIVYDSNNMGDVSFADYNDRSGATTNYMNYPTASPHDKDPAKQKYLFGWSFNADGTNAVAIGDPINLQSYVEANPDVSEITLYAVWEDKCKVTITVNDNKTYTAEVDGKSVTINPFYVVSEQIIKVTPGDGAEVSGPSGITSGYTVTDSDVTKGSIAITVKKKECIAAGTLITLADGTQKKVEDLLESDVLLVFDHESGAFAEAPILFIERDGWAEYDIINLKFSDGRTARLIYEHALFDLTLNKYVYITEQNYEDFIGHEFAVADGEGFDSVTLTEAFVTTEYTGCYSLVTVYHLNYLIDGMLSIPGGIEGLFNFFEYDESLGYDKEQMEKDIETYGLYTYDDFAAYMPEEVYNMFQAQYFKISVGKGYITFEEILELIDRYLVEHGYI